MHFIFRLQFYCALESLIVKQYDFKLKIEQWSDHLIHLSGVQHILCILESNPESW